MSLLWWRQDADAADAENAGAPMRSEPSRSKADIVLETGLTPEEYILAEIEANGGRMKQQTICDVTGWSEGAVSGTLSGMEADGSITRVRIGLGKVVLLTEESAEELPS